MRVGAWGRQSNPMQTEPCMLVHACRLQVTAQCMHTAAAPRLLPAVHVPMHTTMHPHGPRSHMGDRTARCVGWCSRIMDVQAWDVQLHRVHACECTHGLTAGDSPGSCTDCRLCGSACSQRQGPAHMPACLMPSFAWPGPACVYMLSHGLNDCLHL